MILSEGYATKYAAAEVRKRAQWAANAISDMMADTGATSIVVRGAPARTVGASPAEVAWGSGPPGPGRI